MFNFHKGFINQKETKIATNYITKSNIDKLEEIRNRMHPTPKIKLKNNVQTNLQDRLAKLRNISRNNNM